MRLRSRLRRSASGRAVKLCAVSCVLICVVSLWSSPALAQAQAQASTQEGAQEGAHADHLTLEDVLEGLSKTYPKLLAAAQKREAESQALRSAEGLWDPTLSLKGKATLEGKYEAETLNAELRQATPLWGASLYTGYRLGAGDFPTYKGDLETLSRGEWSAGLELPLLAGRDLDVARAAILERERLSERARAMQDLARLEAELGASYAYWSWVEKSELLKIQREFLEMAEARAEAIREHVEHGSEAPITLVDNQRLILERSAAVVEAQRALSAAAYKLSLYYRDQERLTPLRPEPERAPKALTPPELKGLHELEVDERLALNRHPSLLAERERLKALEVKVRLAQAELAPELNVQGFVAKDFGDAPKELAKTLSPTEVGVGLTFKLPLGLNKARGKLGEAEAKRNVAQQTLRGLEDQVIATLRQSRVDFEADKRRAELAQAQVKVAWQLIEAERMKLNEGASDLVILNLREQSYAKAEAMAVKALADYQRAWLTYLASRGAPLAQQLKGD